MTKAQKKEVSTKTEATKLSIISGKTMSSNVPRLQNLAITRKTCQQSIIAYQSRTHTARLFQRTLTLIEVIAIVIMGIRCGLASKQLLISKVVELS